MTRLRIVGAFALMAIVGGCTTQAPMPAPTTTDAVQTPTPSATTEPVQPAPLLDLDCPDLASPQTASQIAGGTVSPVDVNAGPGFSWAMAIQQLGGIHCAWDDGDPENSHFDGTFREVTVTVLPESEAKWQRYVDAFGITGDEGLHCSTRVDYSCGYSALVNGAWIESYVVGIRPAEVSENDDAGMIEYARSFFDSIAAAVLDADSVDSKWHPTALPLPSSCEGFIEPVDIATLAHAPAPVDSFTYRDGPQVAQTLNMDGTNLTTSCSWWYQASEGGIGSMSATPGGAWAWNVQAESLGSTPVDLVGLPDGEQGYYECPDDWRCELNFLYGGNWFTLYLDEGDTEYSFPYAADQPEVLVAIAEKIIANLS